MSDPLLPGWVESANVQAIPCAGCGVLVRVGETIRQGPTGAFTHPGCEQDVSRGTSAT